MCVFKIKAEYSLGDLILLVERLRDAENGCPWDRVQTHLSIRQNFIEEVYEAVEAIDRGDSRMLKEELGDVLLQIALHAEIAKEEGCFDMDGVADAVCKKLVSRHPHIFKDVIANTSDAVLANWEELKRGEKEQRTGTQAIADVPRSMPTLMRSQKVQKRAAYVGFDYPDVTTALDGLDSEVRELREAIAGGGDAAEEIGDLIFAAVNVARLSGADADLAAEKACDKFAGRFRIVEALAAERGIDMKDCPIDVLNDLWSKAKAAFKDAD